MSYVDGFVLVVPNDKLDDYRRMATEAGKIWMELGAVQYVECEGDDVDLAEHGEVSMVPFPRLAQAGPDETVCFSWIVYRDKAHRDAVNAQVMEEPRLKALGDELGMPFDPTRMAYGGFKTIVELSSNL